MMIYKFDLMKVNQLQIKIISFNLVKFTLTLFGEQTFKVINQ